MSTNVSPPPRRSAVVRLLVWATCLAWLVSYGLVVIKLGQTYNDADRSALDVMLNYGLIGLTVVAYWAVIASRPSALRALLGMFVTIILVGATYVSSRQPATSYTYGPRELIGGVMIYLVICLPLVRMYRNDPSD
jgi:hypothetical protein